MKTIPISNATNYIKDASNFKDATGTVTKAEPGDTLYVTENLLLLYIGNLRGTKEAPIKITFAPGVIVGGKPNAYSAWITNSSNFIVDGIHIIGGDGSFGMKMQFVNDFTVKNFTIEKGAVGIQIKDDPSATDASVNYPNYSLSGINLENGTILDSGAEAVYIGNTFTPWIDNAHLPAFVHGVRVRNITIKNAGWDGFQISNADGIDVDGIYVENAGTLKKSGQQSGITIQDNTSGTLSNMTINGSSGGGLTILGRRLIFNNTTINNVPLNAIFMDTRSDRGYADLPPQQVVMNNTTVTGGGTQSVLYNINGPGSTGTVPPIFNNLTYNAALWPTPIRDANKLSQYITTPVPNEPGETVPTPVEPTTPPVVDEPTTPPIDTTTPPTDTTTPPVDSTPTTPVDTTTPPVSEPSTPVETVPDTPVVTEPTTPVVDTPTTPVDTPVETIPPVVDTPVDTTTPEVTPSEPEVTTPPVSNSGTDTPSESTTVPETTVPSEVRKVVKVTVQYKVDYNDGSSEIITG